MSIASGLELPKRLDKTFVSGTPTPMVQLNAIVGRAHSRNGEWCRGGGGASWVSANAVRGLSIELPDQTRYLIGA